MFYITIDTSWFEILAVIKHLREEMLKIDKLFVLGLLLSLVVSVFLIMIRHHIWLNLEFKLCAECRKRARSGVMKRSKQNTYIFVVITFSFWVRLIQHLLFKVKKISHCGVVLIVSKIQCEIFEYTEQNTSK